VLILTLDAGRFGVGSHAGILCAAFLALIHVLCQFRPDGAVPNWGNFLAKLAALARAP
jgi:hypothetical protein